MQRLKRNLAHASDYSRGIAYRSVYPPSITNTAPVM